MRIEEYTARQDEIKKRAEIFGAHYESDFYDKDHLDCFWYDGKSQATFEYKGYAICFDVVGDKSISVFSEDFKSFEHIRRKAGSQPFYDVDEARELVKDELRIPNVDIYVTGSNSKMLSKDMMKLSKDSFLLTELVGIITTGSRLSSSAKPQAKVYANLTSARARICSKRLRALNTTSGTSTNTSSARRRNRCS